MWPLLVPFLLLANVTRWLDPILANIYRERPYETLLLLRHSKAHWSEASDMERSSLPVLHFDEQMNFP